ncbi:DNA (cytosine-5-)-methyltransferase [Sphingomonas ginkgonis]|uniref:Cytosine-specific methyltransferase n=1 Tax=Sphingomonas ginkgonis TaxID=2315330 RepID=A0A3R9WQU7_9SPHN|nr:DNA (cytosine-5-)-methyltransferase [Sphingomonas ginkgonis]RST32115.1 DNA (cytosine-5-)-methyltransferase [Sphingomonas ginkgonis]
MPASTTCGFRVAGMFAGVGGLEEGFRRAGHSSSMLCEFDPAARHVLSRRFADAEISEDVRALSALPDCDVLTAGFPCQDLSQVGRRVGISGPNSGLIGSVFDLLRKKAVTPQWIVLENVPFMLSLDRGRAIRLLAQEFESMGLSWAYRTIDARSFGLPQRRRRVVVLASKAHDPRPVLLGVDEGPPAPFKRGNHACGFYWTEGNTGLGWAIDAVPPLKGGSALHIPSPPAIWFPRTGTIATPSIEDAERLQGFEPGWTDLMDFDPRAARRRWRMVGNAVSVPMAEWIATRLTAERSHFVEQDAGDLPSEGSWPGAGWGHGGRRGRSLASEWPVSRPRQHLASFLRQRPTLLSRKAAAGFLSRLVASSLRYDPKFRSDLQDHVNAFGRP